MELQLGGRPVAGFALADASTTTSTPSAFSGKGFAAGLIIGSIAGFLVGYAVGGEAMLKTYRSSRGLP